MPFLHLFCSVSLWSQIICVSFRCVYSLLCLCMFEFEHRPNGGGTSEIVTLALVLVIVAMHRLRFVSIPSDELFFYCSNKERKRDMKKDEDEKLCFVSSSLSIRFKQRNPTIKGSKSIFVYFSDFFSRFSSEARDFGDKIFVPTFEIWMGFVVCSLRCSIVRPIIISVFVLLVSRCPDFFLFSSIFVYFIYFGEQKVPEKHCRCAVCAKIKPKKYSTNLPDMRNASTASFSLCSRTTKAKETKTRATEASSAEERAHPYIMFIFHAGFVFRFFAPASFAARLACEIYIIFISRVFILNAKRTLTLGRYPHMSQPWTMLLCAVWQLHCIRKVLLLQQKERDKDGAKSNWTRRWNGTENVWRQQNKNEK